MDDDFYKQHAQRVRDLADKADPFTRKRLLDLADKYDAKDQQAEPGIEDDRAADTRASRPNPSLDQADIGRLDLFRSGAQGLGGGAVQAAYSSAACRINPSPPRVFQGFRMLENASQCCIDRR